jgi:hypothetical protein
MVHTQSFGDRRPKVRLYTRIKNGLPQLGRHLLSATTAGVPPFIFTQSPIITAGSGLFAVVLTSFNTDPKKILLRSLAAGLAITATAQHLENRELRGLPPYPIVIQAKDMTNHIAQKTGSFINEFAHKR